MTSLLHGPRRDVTVRPAQVGDVDVLVRFSTAMAQETESRTLDLHRLRQGTLAVLQGNEHGYYLVAEKDTGVVGQLLITYEWSDWRNGVFWWIQSVYVDPPSRRQGVYRVMHAYVLDQARSRSEVCGVRLYVEKDNVAAQAAYRRWGMSQVSYQVYETDFVL
jgi:ribosomal protein S18 acetylase RimI-like enzyme